MSNNYEQEGPKSYRELQEINLEQFDINPELLRISENIRKRAEYPLGRIPAATLDTYGDNYVKSSLWGDSRAYGQSRWDNTRTNLNTFVNLEDKRAQAQWGISKLVNGIAKGGILAGTTFLQNTIGIATGAVESLFEGESTEDAASRIWGNEFQRALDSINKWSEEALPNYYTENEQNREWWRNVFTANFWGDKFIKNLGFTVGAMGSSFMLTGALSALKLPQLVRLMSSKIARNTGSALLKNAVDKAPRMVQSAIGATYQAIGEGSIEALHASDEYRELFENQVQQETKALLDAAYQKYNGDQTNPSYIEEVNQIKSDYENRMATVEKMAAKVGNTTLLGNYPILIASDLIAFGKLYARGFKSAVRDLSLKGQLGNLRSSKSVGKGIVKMVGTKALPEGSEELLQGVVSTTSKEFYGQRTLDLFDHRVDPEATEEVVEWTNTFGEVLINTLGEKLADPNSWEEFTIGALTGFLGLPGIKTNSKGKNRPTMYGGIWEMKDYMRTRAEENAAAEILNNFVNDPKKVALFKGLVADVSIGKEMREAAENQDAFEYKNSEYKSLFNIVSTFSRAGRLEDLYNIIDTSFDTSDENLEAIVESTTSRQDDQGREIISGPFVDKDGNPMYSTEDGKREMIDILTQAKDNYLKTIERYIDSLGKIDTQTGYQLSNDQLDELAWLDVQGKNWTDRATQIIEELRPVLLNLRTFSQELKEANRQMEIYEGSHNQGITEAYTKHRKQKQGFDLLEKLVQRMLDGKTDLLISSEVLDNVAEWIENDPEYFGIDITEVDDVITKLKDLGKIYNSRREAAKKFKEYLENPGKIVEKLDSDIKEAVDKDIASKASSLKDTLASATNLKEFQEAMDSSEEPQEVKNKALEELGDNPIKEEYQKARNFRNEVNIALDKATIDPKVKEAARTLFKNHSDNANSLSELVNPESVFLDDTELIHDDSLTEEGNRDRANRALYEIKKAMSIASYKSKTRESVAKPRSQAAPKAKEVKRKTVGESKVDTTVPVNQTPTQPVQVESTSEDLSDNTELTREEEEPTVAIGPREYYAPTIPELHIGKRKEGDYRPFNVIVKELEGLNFDALYNFLKDLGAFDYVNSGKLKAGDKVYFTIDQELESQMKQAYKGYKGPTILMITEGGQVIGSLPEADNVVSRYQGLRELREKVTEELKNSDRSTTSTTVNKVMLGVIPLGTEERNLADIDGVGDKPILAISNGTTLLTNDRVESDKIILPRNITETKGRLYLLVPNSRGEYSPVAVRAKRFNKQNFNLEDVQTQSNPIFQDVKQAVEAMAKITNEEELKEAVSKLGSSLYLGNLHIDFVKSSKGSGIRFTKVEKDASGNEIYEVVNGKRVRRETSRIVNLASEPLEGGDLISGLLAKQIGEATDATEVVNEILNTLLDFDLNLQINSGMINSRGYNQRLMKSGVLTSNILEARMKSSWFTVNPMRADGKEVKGVPPASKPQSPKKAETPVGGKNSIIPGVKITSNGITYYVDLTTNTVRNSAGNEYITSNNDRLIDLAWAITNKPNETVVQLPNGKFINTITGKYVENPAQREVRKAVNKQTQATLKKLGEDQSKVLKDKTDGEFYYIREEDGEVHQYQRVHKVLGQNWIMSERQEKKLKDIEIRLSQYVDNPQRYSRYVNSIGNAFGVNLSQYLDKTDIQSRQMIISLIRDKMNGTNSTRALQAGTSIDTVIRQFFTSNTRPQKPDNMSQEAYDELLEALQSIKDNMEKSEETFYTNNLVVFHKYPDGTRIAGELDILSVDKNGNFKFYDIKTGRYSFHDFVDYKGRPQNYFINKGKNQKISTRDYYTKQLSLYKELFEAQYGSKVTTLAIMPFVLKYDENTVVGVTSEKGIPLTYKPTLEVPASTEESTQTQANKEQTSTPMIDSFIGNMLDPAVSEVQKPKSENRAMKTIAKEQKLREEDAEFEDDDIDLFTKGEIIDSNQDYLEKELQELRTKTITFSETIEGLPSEAVSKFLESLNKTIEDWGKNHHYDSAVFSKSMGTFKEQEAELEYLDSLIRSITDKLSKAGKSIRFVPNNSLSSSMAISYGNTITIQYNPNLIAMEDKRIKRVLAHELVHAVTAEAVYNVERGTATKEEEEFVESIEQIIQDLNNNKDFHIYFKNLSYVSNRGTYIREWIAEVMSNPNLQRGLAKIKTDEKISLWSRFINALKNFLNKLVGKDTSGTYLEKVINTISLHIDNYGANSKVINILDRFTPKEEVLLAPNGRPSNLTREQYYQVRTPEFKEWFGDWEKVAPSTESAKKLISYVTDISNRNNRFSKLAQLLLDNKALPYNLKYFKIDNNRDDIEGAAGMWHSLVNYIEVLGNNVSQESIDKHLLHELIHYNTEQILQDYKEGKITDDTKKEAIKNLYDIITYAKDFLSKDLQINRSKYLEIAKRQSSTVDSRLFYAFANHGSAEIDEFISEIFTNPGFQEILNNIPYKKSKQTIWSKIKEAISSIFGFDINKGSVLEEALKASSNLLQNNNNVSKVVDENGEPLVVYHGTNSDFNIFDTNKIRLGKMFGVGAYFTPSIIDAQQYAGNNGKIKAVFLNIKNPYNDDTSEDIIYGRGFQQTDKMKELGYDGRFVTNDYDNYIILDRNPTAFIINRNEKYITILDEIVVFNPNQIKSATNNDGSFDRNDNNIDSFTEAKDISEIQNKYHISRREAERLLNCHI